MFKFKSSNPYWTEFSSYQTFENVSDMVDQIKQFESLYDLTPAAKAVLNTIKLHSKRFIGVCWLYREEIARKAGVSLSSVKRVIKNLKESGILTVHEHIHTKRGGQSHNIYVINPIFEQPDEPEKKPANEPPSDDILEQENVDVPMVTDVKEEPYKNSNTNSNTNLKDLSIKIDSTSITDSQYLKHVPNEFIDLLEPFYGHSPKIIHDRWKTVCSAVKRNCVDLSYTSWDTIGEAWKNTVQCLKRGRIRNVTDDGIGAYFYGVLCDYLFNDFWRNGSSVSI